jgi:glycosyltransferase involved in cell wall biosynthesis
VWEKGHQDVLRALATVRRGLDGGPAVDMRLRIVGTGPEEERLRRYANELGMADAVEFRGFIPYEEMPAAYGEAACMVLASLPTWSWEEQFGMVLAEAMAANLPIIASTSGAIPEVTGSDASYFAPGDWVGLAERLRELLTVKRAPQATRADRYSTAAAAKRIAAAYDELLSGEPPAR